MKIGDRKLKIGEWMITMHEAYHTEVFGWYVYHQIDADTCSAYGPYSSREEAVEKSGIPTPKTELEEVWETAKVLEYANSWSMRPLDGHANVSAYRFACSVSERFKELSKKYNKA